MVSLPTVNAQQIIKILQKLGFEITRQKGSHIRLKHGDGRVVTVPVHSGKNLGKGLLLKILRDVQISKEEFVQLLQKN
ncbi:hypothetical protein NIES970_21050 [[Synechococcus] sp. NIES-970]|nr:hypothetical protein NIES970_21050 [[Synechococcus] sp. NIES-970]